MGSVNKVFLVGNLGRDAEQRHTTAGRAVSNFTLATTDTWTDKASGQRQERTEWHRVVVWGRQAESLQPYLTKGKQICVEGRLQTRSWEDQNGMKRYMTEIVANEMQMLSARQQNEPASDAPGGVGSTAAEAPPSSPEADSDDDLPF